MTKRKGRGRSHQDQPEHAYREPQKRGGSRESERPSEWAALRVGSGSAAPREPRTGEPRTGEPRTGDDEAALRRREPRGGYRSESYPGHGYPSRPPGGSGGRRGASYAGYPLAAEAVPEGYYGSGGSYGYGGGFEHDREGWPEFEHGRHDRSGPRGQNAAYSRLNQLGRPNDAFYEHTGSFGGDLAYGRRSFGVPPARGPFYGRTPKGYLRSDERIREDLCDQLGHGHIDPSEIVVAVAAGVVTLSGLVESRAEKFYVEELAEGVLGVKDVDNRLRVKPAGDAQAREE